MMMTSWGVTSLLVLSVSAVADVSQFDASVLVSGLVLTLSIPESLQKMRGNLVLTTGSAEDLVDEDDDWDVPLELAELSGLAGDKLLALFGLDLELLEGSLQLAHLGGQV